MLHFMFILFINYIVSYLYFMMFILFILIAALNIMRVDGRFKLIDLDASAPLLPGYYAGAKYSSAYVPPEMIYVSTDSENSDNLEDSTNSVDPVIKIKSFVTSDQCSDPSTANVPYPLVQSSIEYDMWSLGVTLFQMFSGEPLFLSNDEDNIDQESLLMLYNWPDDFKRKKLAKISDPLARNLTSQLLNKEPSKRPSADRILSHPFLSGKKSARMVGEDAEYDVFISYRVASDAMHAEILYKSLTESGVKVWWDKACLLPGVPWEEGFCDGLVKSRAFVPLLSRAAINHPSIPKQNFCRLTEESLCDNVLLESRLALELRDRGLIEKIFPIMIGDKQYSKEYAIMSDSVDLRMKDRSVKSFVYSDYFLSGCHPRAPNLVVAAVEAKLWFHLERQGLGAPLRESLSVSDILNELTANQGGHVKGPGDGETEFIAISRVIIDMIAGCHDTHDLSRSQSIAHCLTSPPSKSNLITSGSSGGGGGGGVKAILNALHLQVETLRNELKLRDELLDKFEKENISLKLQLSDK